MKLLEWNFLEDLSNRFVGTIDTPANDIFSINIVYTSTWLPSFMATKTEFKMIYRT